MDGEGSWRRPYEPRVDVAPCRRHPTVEARLECGLVLLEHLLRSVVAVDVAAASVAVAVVVVAGAENHSMRQHLTLLRIPKKLKRKTLMSKS